MRPCLALQGGYFVYPLSQREACACTGWGEVFPFPTALTLTLSQRERGQEGTMVQKGKVFAQKRSTHLILCCVCGGLVFFVLYVPLCERINSSHKGTMDTKVFSCKRKPYAAFRRRRAYPSPANPRPMIASVAGSGTSAPYESISIPSFAFQANLKPSWAMVADQLSNK